jgi:hypothetical protein
MMTLTGSRTKTRWMTNKTRNKKRTTTMAFSSLLSCFLLHNTGRSTIIKIVYNPSPPPLEQLYHPHIIMDRQKRPRQRATRLTASKVRVSSNLIVNKVKSSKVSDWAGWGWNGWREREREQSEELYLTKCLVGSLAPQWDRDVCLSFNLSLYASLGWSWLPSSFLPIKIQSTYHHPLPPYHYYTLTLYRVVLFKFTKMDNIKMMKMIFYFVQVLSSH